MEKARAELENWSREPNYRRTQYLTSLAKVIQENERLLWTLDSLVTGRSVREVRDRDVPLALQLLQYYADQSLFLEKELSGWKPMGEPQAASTPACPAEPAFRIQSLYLSYRHRGHHLAPHLLLCGDDVADLPCPGFG